MLRSVSVALLWACVLSACDDPLWIERPLLAREEVLRGVAVRMEVPEGMVVTTRSERQIIFYAPDTESDRRGMSPSLRVSMWPTGPVPSGPEHIAIPGGAEDITRLDDGRVRVRVPLEHTVSETHFVPRPGGDGYAECHVVMYGAVTRIGDDVGPVQAWADRVCGAVRPR